jgi:VWFA-related protein
MTRAAWSVPVLAGLVWVSLDARQEPRFRAGVDSVSVFATVVDSDQRLVTGLEESDFEVYDNGVRQTVTAFSNAPQAFTMVMMLDRSGSMASHFDRVRRAANVFIDHLLPTDRLKVGSFSSRIQIDPAVFTSDPDELRRILATELQGGGDSPVWAATSAAMNTLASQDGRRVILLFSDGHDSTSLGAYVPFREVRARAEDEDVMVYAIGFTEPCASTQTVVAPRYQGRGPTGMPGGRPPGGGRGGPGGGRRPGLPAPIPRYPPSGPGLPLPYPRRPQPVEARPLRCFDRKPNDDLRRLTEAAGGGYFELERLDDVDRTFARVAEELHQQYLLAFTPHALDNRTHQIEVRVKGTGRTVRARRSYVARQE